MVVHLFYAATKPKARSTMGFVLLAAQIMRYVGGGLGTTLQHEQARAGNVGELLERGG